uniref:Palmitoyltransferase n=1 Tax=Lygus hesperus TaxID=30085 RepID=A0A0A9ZA29_LYGHE
MLCILTLICLFCTVAVNPGIVLPVDTHSPLSRTCDAMVQSTTDQVVILNGHPITLKYCHTCNLVRPPRCSHCRECDVCVEESDHHCGIVGCCVGRRNFRFFTGFFVFLTLMCVWGFVRSLV